MVNSIENFLTTEECKYFVDYIEKSNFRSSVAEGKNTSVVSDVRTSHTSTLDREDEKVKNLKKKIAAFLGLPLEKGEDLQGQKYEVGQFFKPHTDFFQGDSYDNHCLSSGNRTHTLMIYLSDVEEGGETTFPRIGKSFFPKTGRAVYWENMVDGVLQDDMLHEGSNVKKGVKYIITSWWRENDWNPAEDSKLAQNLKEANDQKLTEQKESDTMIISEVNKKVFKTSKDLPRISDSGYKVIKTPTYAWNIIKEMYEVLKKDPQVESFQQKEEFIPTGDSEIFNLDKVPTVRGIIHKELQKVHEDWIYQPLEPSFIYGIRSYTKGATLKTHVDKVATHHISSIIIVDKDLACGCRQTKGVENDWALDFQTHDGTWHKVYAEIGDMILYESAVCEHGRLDEFKGNFFRNFYVHYKLRDWEFNG